MEGKYENPEGLIKTRGWTPEQVNRYLPFLESAGPEKLRELHKKAGIDMFKDTEPVDEEQAIFVLTNGHDIAKDDLFKILDSYIEN